LAQAKMRFLLLSFLSQTVLAAVGKIQCGTFHATADSAKYWFVSKNSCGCDADNKLLAKSDDDSDNAGGTKIDSDWWGTDRAALGAGAASCAYDKSPLKVTTPEVDVDGFFDNKSYKNFEVKENYISIGDGTGYFKPGTDVEAAYGSVAPLAADFATGIMAVMEGELVDSTIYAAAKTGIKGTNAGQGDPIAFCSHATRGGFGDLLTADNIMIDKIVWTDRGRCKGGVVDPVASAAELGHNTVGDGTKFCYNLTWTAAPQAAEACTATTTRCDRFVEGESQCILNTKVMDTTAASRAAATTAKAHCMIQPNAGTDDKYRHLDAAFKSQACTATYFCNPYASSAIGDPVCLQHVIGNGSVSSQVRADGVLVKAGSVDLKACLGVTLGAEPCTATEVCNPHASTRATMCINKTATSTLAGIAAFGAVGAAAPATGTDLRGHCIGDNQVGSICGAQTVCNYAGGTQTGNVAGGEVCLAHTKLLGEIADTAAWTAAAQRKLPGVAGKYCLATNGTTYSSKECVAADESCNPHAAQVSDVCIKTITILKHGEIAPLAADPVADSKTACIGLTLWKQCSSETDTAKFVCNEGAANDTDVCIDTTACVVEDKPLEGFWVAGVEATDDQKWCFAKDGAAKCGLDTICNPAGEHGGSNEKAICADATRRVPHGDPGDSTSDPALDFCLGKTGNSVLAADDEEGWLCDEGKGKFHNPVSKMEGRAAAPPPAESGSDTVIADICFGDGQVEKCSEGVYCNTTGDETGCSSDKCTVSNICVTEDSLIDDDAPFVADGRSVCLNSDATAGENCTEDKPFCDRSTGLCVAEQVQPTDDPSDPSPNSPSSGAVAGSLAAAAVVAILSA